MCALQEKSEGLAEEAWAAVQCLVYAGCHSAAIIASLLQYLFNDHSPSKQAKAGDLMVKVSLKTVSLHSQFKYSTCILPIVPESLGQSQISYPDFLPVSWKGPETL